MLTDSEKQVRVKRSRGIKPKATKTLETFVQVDIQDIVARHRDQKTPKKQTPILSDVGLFLEGVRQDLKFMYPNISNQKDFFLKWVQMWDKEEQEKKSKF